MIFNGTIIIVIAISQVLDSTAWDDHNALILTQLTESIWGTYKCAFPTVIRESKTHPKVYYPESRAVYAYCPVPDTRECYYPEKKSRIYDAELLEDISTTKCQERVTAMMSRHRSCTHNENSGHLYKLVYETCDKFKNGQINQDTKRKTIVYEVCYDETGHRIILGSYTIANPSLLTNPLLKEEQNHRLTYYITDPYGFEEFQNQFNIIIHPRYEKDKRYVQRTVLPPEWLPFVYQRIPLRHYVNVAPMDIRLRPNWILLMNNLRKKISKMPGPIHVTAGTLGKVVRADKSEVYLGGDEDRRKITIPKYWWILIENENRTEGVVVTMMNDTLNLDYSLDHDKCGSRICEKSNIKDSLPLEQEHADITLNCCERSVITDKFNLTPSGLKDLLVLPST